MTKMIVADRVNGVVKNQSGLDSLFDKTILLVDDTPANIAILSSLLSNFKRKVATNGAKALALAGSGNPPDLILLDLNLPRKDGRDVLAEVKADPSLKSIPVVILTTSASDVDIESSYLLHANCYITKPVDLDGFLTVVRSIDSFWFSVVKLPSVETP